MTARIELVTFDLDNTLWEVDSVIREAERVMRAWLDQRAPGFAELTTDQYVALRAAVIRDHPALAHDVTRLRIAVLERVLENLGQPHAVAARLAEQALDVFLHERHNVKFFEGALETLEVLAARYPLAALTNGNANVERLGLSRFFRFGLSAADVGMSKPHPAMFRAALARTGSSAERAVHVGDHLVDDIQGAAAAGFKTVWVNLKEATLPLDVRPSREVRALKALPGVIEELAG